MSGIYCGIGKVPKKMKLGTAKECIEKGQARMYGLKKIEKELIDEILKIKKSKPSRIKLASQLGTARGKMRLLKKIIENDKDKKKVEKAKKEFKIQQTEARRLIKLLEKKD